MFKLKNKEGNAFRTVNSEVKKDALVKEGWVLVEEPDKAPKNKRKGAGADEKAEEE